MLNPALNLNSVNAMAIRAEQFKQLLQGERRNQASRLSVVPLDLIQYYITPYVFNGPFLLDNLVPVRNTQAIKSLIQERKVVKKEISINPSELSFDSNSSCRANKLCLGLLGMSLIVGGGSALLHPIPSEISLSFLAAGLVVISHVCHNYHTTLANQTEQTRLDCLKAKYSDLRTRIFNLKLKDYKTNEDNFVKILVRVKEEILKDLENLNALVIDYENNDEDLNLQNKYLLISNKVVANLEQLLGFEVLSLSNSSDWTDIDYHVQFLKVLSRNNKDVFDILNMDIPTIRHIEGIIERLIANPPPMR